MSSTALSGRYAAYPEYKDSGVQWLGDVPQDWGCIKLKYIADLQSNKTESGSAEKYVGMENVESWSGRYIPTADVKPEGLSNSFSCGDILFGKLRPYLAKSWIADFSGICSSEFLVLEGQQVSPRFLNYYFLTEEFIEQVDSSTYGSKMPRASWDFISLMGVPVPPVGDSEKIANFLDHETAKIDTLIEKQQQLIKLLKEKRQAVISHAVTKGLNPDVPMRDSRVEWLGDVPEHWELPKLIHRTSRIGDGLHSTPKYQDNTGYYFVNGNNLVNGEISLGITAKEVSEHEFESHYIYLDEYSVLISINGTIGNVARYKYEQVILGKSAAYVNCKEGLLPEYLMLYLQSSHALRYFDLEVTGTTIFNLSLNSIRQMHVCIPPEVEQVEIDKYGQTQQKKYDLLINKSNSAMAYLHERRTALISAAVTGKIDVRNWQAPEPSSNQTEAMA